MWHRRGPRGGRSDHPDADRRPDRDHDRSPDPLRRRRRHRRLCRNSTWPGRRSGRASSGQTRLRASPGRTPRAPAGRRVWWSPSSARTAGPARRRRRCCSPRPPPGPAVQVRLIDAADPASSGLVGAAVTEHGCDESGQWRCGTRGSAVGSGQLRLERLAQRPAEPAAVPAAATTGTVTLTIVDAGWPLAELLRLAGQRAERRHWLGQLIHGSALVLTARASVPGVQRLAAAAAEVDGVRNLDQPHGGRPGRSPPAAPSARRRRRRLPAGGHGSRAGGPAPRPPRLRRPGRHLLRPAPPARPGRSAAASRDRLPHRHRT